MAVAKTLQSAVAGQSIQGIGIQDGRSLEPLQPSQPCFGDTGIHPAKSAADHQGIAVIR